MAFKNNNVKIVLEERRKRTNLTDRDVFKYIYTCICMYK